MAVRAFPFPVMKFTQLFCLGGSREGLIQRVSQAQVSIEGQVVGQIDEGLLLLLGVERRTPGFGGKAAGKGLGLSGVRG